MSRRRRLSASSSWSRITSDAGHCFLPAAVFLTRRYTWSAHTIGRAEAIDFQWDWLEGLRARGVVALLVGEPVQAVQSLRMAWEHVAREGVDEPGVFPVAPDLVEALVELGDVDQAQAVASRHQMLAEQQGHPRGLASAKRCSALIRLASPTSDGSAATDLQVAARHLRESRPSLRGRQDPASPRQGRASSAEMERGAALARAGGQNLRGDWFHRMGRSDSL